MNAKTFLAIAAVAMIPLAAPPALAQEASKPWPDKG